MKRNLYLIQRTGSSTAHVLYFAYFHWRASEPEVSIRTRVNSYRSNLKTFIEVRICLLRISSDNVRDSERGVKILKIMEGTRGRVRFEVWKWLQNSWTGRARSEPGGKRWGTGGEVKGKLANGVGSQYSHATFQRGVSSITTADAHTSAASSRLNWRPHRFEWTRPFRGETKSGFCACAIRFRTSSTYYTF